MSFTIPIKAVSEILGQYGDSIAKSVKKCTKKGWEQFKLDFGTSYQNYLLFAYEKYSYVKTLLYKADPQPLYDFFEVPYLQKGKKEKFQANAIDDVVARSRFIIIKGTGGIGKSTLMKHLFLSAVKSNIFIPIFLELKDLNTVDSSYELMEYIYGKLENQNCKFQKEYFDVVLRSGRLVFLFDGYDEMLTEKRNIFTKKLEDFIDHYFQNVFILSSRPFSDFVYLQRFTVLDALPFEKAQAVSMVRKLHCDENTKKKFIQQLQRGLFEKHQSFASNPLLLTIMLLTYDDYADIPEKLHSFYANAFDTLYNKHDATKSGFIRPIKSCLSKEDFKLVFAQFCFVTYWNNQLEFSKEAFADILKKITAQRAQFDIDGYIDDLEHALCVVYVDGLNYTFSHRSFQEYFTAYFLRKQSDDTMKQLTLKLIEQDAGRAAHDNVLPMLYDMEEDRVEQNILLPLLVKFDESSDTSELYDYYFQTFISGITFHNPYGSKKIQELRQFHSSFYHDDLAAIIESLFVIFCRKNSLIFSEGEPENELLRYLAKKYKYSPNTAIYRVSNEEIMKDKELYSIVKRTHIGEWVRQLSDLRTTLTEKKKKTNQDLFAMLQSV